MLITGPVPSTFTFTACLLVVRLLSCSCSDCRVVKMSFQLVTWNFSLAQISGTRSTQVDSGSANSVKAPAISAMKAMTMRAAEAAGGTPWRSSRVAIGPNMRPMITARKTGSRKKRP